MNKKSSQVYDLGDHSLLRVSATQDAHPKCSPKDPMAKIFPTIEVYRKSKFHEQRLVAKLSIQKSKKERILFPIDQKSYLEL